MNLQFTESLVAEEGILINETAEKRNTTKLSPAGASMHHKGIFGGKNQYSCHNDKPL